MWVWSMLAGCGSDGGDTAEPVDGCEPGGSPTVEIGTGEQQYEPMPPEVELVHGPQGGYHVVVAFEATHLDDSDVIEGVVEGTIDGEVVAVSEPFFELACNPDTHTQQAWGQLLIYPLTPLELDNQPTTITARLTDVAGTTAEGSVETTIVDPLVE